MMHLNPQCRVPCRQLLESIRSGSYEYVEFAHINVSSSEDDILTYLKRKKDLTGPDPKFNDTTPLQHACARGFLKVIKFLEDGKFSIDWTAEDQNGSTPASTAAANGRVNVIEHLVKNKIDIDLRAPLIAAVMHGHLNVIEYLIRNDVDPTVPDAKGDSVFDLAKQSGKQHVIDYLRDWYFDFLISPSQMNMCFYTNNDQRISMENNCLQYSNKYSFE